MEHIRTSYIDCFMKSVLCCCLPTPMTLASGGESDLPACGPPASFPVHLASSAVTPAESVHKSRGDTVVRMWVQLKRWCVSCAWVLQRGHSGDGCDLASTLFKFDLFVLSWARVRRVRRGSICSELIMCGGVRRILLFPLVARCLETIDICIWCMFVFRSVVMNVWGSVGSLLCNGRC